MAELLTMHCLLLTTTYYLLQAVEMPMAEQREDLLKLETEAAELRLAAARSAERAAAAERDGPPAAKVRRSS